MVKIKFSDFANHQISAYTVYDQITSNHMCGDTFRQHDGNTLSKCEGLRCSNTPIVSFIRGNTLNTIRTDIIIEHNGSATIQPTREYKQHINLTKGVGITRKQVAR